MAIKARFSNHSIQLDGLHIIGVTEEGVEIDMLIPREDAILFEWIEPEDGIDSDEEYIGSEYRRKVRKERELAKLEAWNKMVGAQK